MAALLLAHNLVVPTFPVKSFMYVVAGSAGQGIEVNIHFLEVLMLFQVLAMTAVALCHLLVSVMHRLSDGMNRVAG
jgi:hypothetical protein